ncbi:DUF397 domain-containing protein [Kitasatospora sp. NPDC056783]|uniref:DUF397 domain-containing protein n=1 Tax=Kitasatospora sp. NPDC056783 TaxID=3345943 RepID=UPI003676B883
MRDSKWQKSSYSGASSECVEVRTVSDTVELRESDEGHLVLRTTPAALADLLHALKTGEFDYPPVR